MTAFAHTESIKENDMKVVKIRHLKDNTGREYLFATSKSLKVGDIVLCEVKTDKEEAGICTSDSKEIAKEALEFLAFDSRYTFPLKSVIGKMERW